VSGSEGRSEATRGVRAEGRSEATRGVRGENPFDHISERGGIAPVMQRSYDRPAGLDNPRAPRRSGAMPNFEKYAWLFMRFSGVVLIFLALGHLFVMLMWENGVYRIDFNYVAQRWSSPFWQTWDLLLLWLAQLHGGNGMRTIIADYARKDSTKFWLNTLLALSMLFTLVLGSYVLLTFDANIS
jgi:succinate dehydrogenase / fumarate reductase, membrane anchor subunit